MTIKLSESTEVVWGVEQFGAVSLRLTLAGAVLILVMFAEAAVGQSIFGRISGTVTDAQGGAVAGVKITLVTEDSLQFLRRPFP